MRSNAAKKKHHPPFKHTVPRDTAASTHSVQLSRNHIHALALRAAHSFADDYCAANPTLRPAPFAPGMAAAVSEPFRVLKTTLKSDGDAPSRGAVTDPLSSTETAFSLEGCVPSRPQLQQLVNARRAEYAGTKVWSLVEDTIYWVTVAQAALQHLADAKTAGQIQRVLSELHIDPSTVLFSVEDGSFSRA
ncbi:hypothetical protein, unknown function [Leishmania tarentolae]|uniref:Uncharacterized protein n=1 Tax=Leishmania tarentolae TaxID=5689 RepID=A0A640KSY4_LEITA|nr:hypothetical protein, unknown function [Leishmania tarentolae]